MADLLANRYGDGVVYIESDQQRQLFRAAIARGLVTSTGFVTLKGRGLLARVRATVVERDHRAASVSTRTMTSVGE